MPTAHPPRAAVPTLTHLGGLSIHMLPLSLRPAYIGVKPSTVNLRRRIAPVVAAFACAWALTPQTACARSDTSADPVTVRIPDQIRTDERRDVLDWTLGSAQVLAVLAAFGGLLAVRRQIIAAREQIEEARKQVKAANDQTVYAQADAKRQRTVAFQDRFTSPDFAAAHARVFAFLDVNDAHDAIDKIRSYCAAPHAEHQSLARTPRDPAAPMASRIDVNNVFGFYENLGAEYRLDQLDKPAFKHTFGPVPASAFRTAWWYVCWRRGGTLRRPGELAVFAGFEDLAREIAKGTPSLHGDSSEEASIRVLVLPDKRYADSIVWDLCGRLSATLSAPSVSLAEWAARAPHCGDADEGSVVQEVIAVPPDHGHDWVRSRKSAEDVDVLRRWLRTLDRQGLEGILVAHGRHPSDHD